MLEIIYRVYEIPDKEKKEEIAEENAKMGRWYELDRMELCMDAMVCESRERFKELMRENWGQELSFAKPRKPQGGERYCFIIGEHAYTDSLRRMFSRTEYICDFCGKKVTGFMQDKTKIDNGTVKFELLNADDKYSKLNFCSHSCQRQFIDLEKQNFNSDDVIAGNLFVTPDSFSHKGIAGWIYIITKKSTGEFYVGQTYNCPVFRWGQHLTTGRFPLTGIEDYQFEVLEVVKSGEKLLEREAAWINTMRSRFPDKCLNIALPKGEKTKDKGGGK